MTKQEEIEARKAEIRTEIEKAENVEKVEELRKEVETLNEESKMIEERKLEEEVSRENETRSIPMKEIKKEDEKMNMEEKRNSKEYINAYAEYLKSSLCDKYEMNEEARSLVTTQGYATGNSASVAVPDFVENVVKTAWEREELAGLVRRISVAGNYKVQFEVSSTDAQIHTEGNGKINEEELILGIVTLVPQSIKKFISVSDEVLDMRGEDFLEYIYDELTYRIAKKCVDTLIGKIKALPQSLAANESGIYDTVSAAKITTAPALGTIAEAVSKLSDEARDITIVMNKETYATFKAVQYAGNYGIDIFEGHRVVFNNSLPAYNSADNGAVYAIVGDFGVGALFNFPNGEGIDLKYDDKTAMEYDLVRILGREYVGIDAVADKAFTLIAKTGEVSE